MSHRDMADRRGLVNLGLESTENCGSCSSQVYTQTRQKIKRRQDTRIPCAGFAPDQITSNARKKRMEEKRARRQEISHEKARRCAWTAEKELRCQLHIGLEQLTFLTHSSN